MDKFIIKTPRYQVAKDPLQVLKTIFKLEEFRGQQLEICSAALDKKDLVVIMQTGGGKSLTYQLPAVMDKGVTLIVSPLLALIQNQVDSLLSLKIKAGSLNSTIKKKEKDALMKDLQSKTPLIKLLYVTPELLASESFRSVIKKLYAGGNFARLVIDEAHCISEWGHDFRNDFRKLNYWKSAFPSLPISALTATATDTVQKDIIQSLNLNNPKIFLSSFNRSNLHYEVRFKDSNNDPSNDVLKFLNLVYSNRKARLAAVNENGIGATQRIEGVCGIIYCSTREKCKEVADILKSNNIRAACYHAGLPQKERTAILQAWSGTDESTIADSAPNQTGPISSNSVIDIVCATISFGMGIDKKNVRFVIHWDIPKSFEGYYQESGRAGRDGKVSRCILYYSQQGDFLVSIINYVDRDRTMFLSKSTNADREKQSMGSFEALVKYCESYNKCRHILIHEYFSKHPPNLKTICPEKRCDYCKNPEKVKEKTSEYLLSRQKLVYDGAGSFNHEEGQSSLWDPLAFVSASDYDSGRKGNSRPKRQYDSLMIDETEEEKLRNSQQYGGFQTASSLLGNNGKIDRSYFFGKKKKTAAANSDDEPSKFQLLYPTHEIPGLKSATRDKFIMKLSEKLNEKLSNSNSVRKMLPIGMNTEQLAIEIEGECFKNCKMLVMYQYSTFQQLRKLVKFEFDENWLDAKVEATTHFYHSVLESLNKVVV